VDALHNDQVAGFELNNIARFTLAVEEVVASIWIVSRRSGGAVIKGVGGQRADRFEIIFPVFVAA
jgi:hypothetical protein